MDGGVGAGGWVDVQEDGTDWGRGNLVSPRVADAAGWGTSGFVGGLQLQSFCLLGERGLSSCCEEDMVNHFAGKPNSIIMCCGFCNQNC